MSKYYLVAKNKASKKFEIVKIRGNEIYQDGSNAEERCFNLEKIDLFTSRFNSEMLLKLYLKNNGKVKFDDFDLFVVSRNGKNIKFLNCIYDMSSRTGLLRNIMMASDLNKKSNLETYGCRLLDDFIENLFGNKGYYDMVIYGFTDIYKKFYDYFRGRNTTVRDLKAKKFSDGKWAISSYNLHRSIVDSYQMYNSNYKNRDDMFTALANKRNKDRLNRESIMEELLVQTDKDYVDGQISMFDEIEMGEANDSVTSSATDKKVEVKREDKLLEVFEYLDRFPRGMFVGDNLEFNQNIFPGMDVSGLNKISVRLKRLINSYTVLKYHYDKALEYNGNTRELAIDLKQDRKAINKLLESGSILDKFYNFCILYDRIKEEYELKVKGDNKVYGKREDN